MLNPIVQNSAGDKNSPLLLNGSIQSSNSNQEFELEDLFTAIGKRVFANAAILVLFGNTLSAIFSISAAVSLIQDNSSNPFNYSPCDYGDSLGNYTQCPYLPSPVFGTCLAIWSCYFCTLFVYKYHRTYPYFTNDLRFYLACDMVNNEWFLFVLVIVGFIFTFASGVTGIYYAFHNGAESSVGSIFVFMFVNSHSLFAMLGGHYSRLKGLTFDQIFPSPIPLKPGFEAGRKIFLSHRDVFDSLIEVVLLCHVSGNDKELEKIGDPKQLKAVVALLCGEK